MVTLHVVTPFPDHFSISHALDYFFVLHVVTLFSDNLVDIHVVKPNSTIPAKIHANTPTIVIPFHYFTCRFTHFSHFFHFSMMILHQYFLLCYLSMLKHCCFVIFIFFVKISVIFQITSFAQTELEECFSN
jgi:hypothetical protein